MNTSNIREHMEVIGADGVHVGTVDGIEGDRIKLTKKDSGEGSHKGHHHYIPASLVAEVEGDKVRLSANSDVAVELRGRGIRSDLTSFRAQPARCDQTGNRSPAAGVAAKTPRAIARAIVAPAAAYRSIASSPDIATPLRPVASENTMSPSAGVWVGQMARAKPSCAAIASRLAAALVSTASVAMTAIVVLAPTALSRNFSRIVLASSGIGDG